ncbi:MAG TPA: M48 family metallopeptidase [Patescibacteria group bacterium]|nr:M48 family metallopeptidase [Patescibacteria group bacterium]
MSIYSQIARNKARTFFIIFFFVVFISFFFYLIGKYVGDPTTFFILGLLFSFFSGVASYFYSDKMVLFMMGARPADRHKHFDFYTVAENLSIAAGLPKPRLYVIEDEALNAFATGRNPKHAVVAATTGILEKLERSELEGVIAHELSHIKNYDILLMSIVSILVGMVVYVSDWTMRSMWWGGMRRDSRSDRRSGALLFIIFLIFLILMPIVATLVQLALSRRREYLADASGALLTRNPDGLARALEKISTDPHILHTASNATAHLFIANPLHKKSSAFSWISGLFSTHPPVTERIKLLREM